MCDFIVLLNLKGNYFQHKGASIVLKEQSILHWDHFLNWEQDRVHPYPICLESLGPGVLWNSSGHFEWANCKIALILLMFFLSAQLFQFFRLVLASPQWTLETKRWQLGSSQLGPRWAVSLPFQWSWCSFEWGSLSPGFLCTTNLQPRSGIILPLLCPDGLCSLHFTTLSC